MKQRVCEVYRCSKKEGMYIYTAKEDGVNKIPEAIKQRAGGLELAMTLLITPEKKLARAKAEDVLIAIDNQGFYLQMPPSPSAQADAMNKAIDSANDFFEPSDE